MILAIVTSLRHLLGWVAIAFRSREDLIFENLALRQQLLALHAKRPRRSIDSSAQAVLDRLENVLVGVDEASRLGYSSNRGAVASGWLPVVLDLGFKAWTSGGRRRVSKQVRALICRMGTENPTRLGIGSQDNSTSFRPRAYSYLRGGQAHTRLKRGQEGGAHDERSTKEGAVSWSARSRDPCGTE